jgi:hypothetical protein
MNEQRPPLSCRGCGKPIDRAFSVFGAVYPSGFDPEDEAMLNCPHCGRSEAWPFTLTNPEARAVVRDFSMPDTCPSCGAAIEAVDCAFDINYDVDPPSCDGFLALCPICHDDITHLVTFSSVVLPAHTIKQPRRCRVCGCTDDNPCVDVTGTGCAWSDEFVDLCTACLDKVDDKGVPIEADQDDEVVYTFPPVAGAPIEHEPQAAENQGAAGVTSPPPRAPSPNLED